MDAKSRTTSEPIAGVMSGYGFTAAGTTYDFEDRLTSSSLSPPASRLPNDDDANGSANVNFQYDALGRRVARTGTGGSTVFVQMDQQTVADYLFGDAASVPTYRYVYASYIDEPVVRKTAGTVADPSPCGTSPGLTIHCRVLVVTGSRVRVSKSEAISMFFCYCCDPANPGGSPVAQAVDFPRGPHFPGGNRPPNHSIDP